MNLNRLLFLIGTPLAIVLVAFGYFLLVGGGVKDVDSLHVRLAVPRLPSSTTIFVAQNKQFFQENGVLVGLQTTKNGRDALAQVLEGKSDIALVADIPFVLSVMNGQDLVVLATVYKSRKGEVLVARRDRGISDLRDLRGKVIGTQFGTNAQYLADTLLQSENINSDDVKFINYDQNDLPDALVSSKVDAATIWLPLLKSVEQRLGNNAVIFYGNDLYAWRFNLVARRSFVDANGDRIVGVMRAIDQAIAYVHQHPDVTQQIATMETGIDPETIRQILDPDEFVLRLDQALLIAFDEQSRWAIRRGIPASKSVPNYLHFINTDLLASLRRDAVTIIR